MHEQWIPGSSFHPPNQILGTRLRHCRQPCIGYVGIGIEFRYLIFLQVYHSSDIQQHLSSYAFTFSNGDREFRELMSQTAKNPAVLAICIKDG